MVDVTTSGKGLNFPSIEIDLVSTLRLRKAKALAR
jgi:hypothetical protein